jgi:hypothetical protein
MVDNQANMLPLRTKDIECVGLGCAIIKPNNMACFFIGCYLRDLIFGPPDPPPPPPGKIYFYIYDLYDKNIKYSIFIYFFQIFRTNYRTA